MAKLIGTLFLFLLSTSLFAQKSPDDITFILDGKEQPLPREVTQRLRENPDFFKSPQRLARETLHLLRFSTVYRELKAYREKGSLKIVGKTAYRISSLEILDENNKNIDFSLIPDMRLKEGNYFSREFIPHDIYTVRTYLNGKGYFSAKYETQKISYDEDRKSIYLVLYFHKGTQCKITDFTPKDFFDIIGSGIKGLPCDKNLILEKIQNQESTLIQNGYIQAELSLDKIVYNPSKTQGIARLNVKKGDRISLSLATVGNGRIISTERGFQEISKETLSEVFESGFNESSKQQLEFEVVDVFKSKGYLSPRVSSISFSRVSREEMEIQVFVNPGERAFIKDVILDGQHPLEGEDIMDRLDLTPSFFENVINYGRSNVPLVESELETYRDELAGMMHAKGYRDAKLSPFELKLQPELGQPGVSQFYELHSQVKAGQQYFVHSISHVYSQPIANFVLDRFRLLNILGTDDLLGVNNENAYKNEILRQLNDKGYLLANVRLQRPLKVTKTEKNKNYLQVTFIIDPGPRITFDRLIFEGRDFFGKEERIGKILSFERGEVLSQKRLREGERSISQHGLFQSVSLTPDIPASARVAKGEVPVPVVFTASLPSGANLSFSTSWGSLSGYNFYSEGRLNRITSGGMKIIGSLGFSQENNQKINSGQNIHFIGQEAKIGAIWPLTQFYNWVSPFDTEITLSHLSEPQSLYNLNANKILTSITYRPRMFGLPFNHSFGIELDFETLEEKTESNIDNERALDFLQALESHIYSFFLETRVDERNNPSYPTRGFTFNTKLGHSSHIFGSSFDFTRIRWDFTYFKPWTDRIHSTFFFGSKHIFGFLHKPDTPSDENMIIPPESRLFGLENKSIVRGFPTQGLPPGPALWLDLMDSQENTKCQIELLTLKGTHSIFAKFETQYRASENWALFGFLDSGASFIGKKLAKRLRNRMDEATSDSFYNGCYLGPQGMALIDNHAMTLDGNPIEQYLNNGYFSFGVGARFILAGFTLASLEFGIPFHEPNDSAKCTTYGKFREADSPPECIERSKSPDEFSGFQSFLPFGWFHLSIGVAY